MQLWRNKPTRDVTNLFDLFIVVLESHLLHNRILYQAIFSHHQTLAFRTTIFVNDGHLAMLNEIIPLENKEN